MTRLRTMDKRKKDRYPFTVLVRCTEMNGSRSQEFTAHDISAQGARLKSHQWAGVDRCPRPGSRVLLNGLVYTEEGSVALRGRVAWTKIKQEDASFELGLKFVNIRNSSILEELSKWNLEQS